MTERTRAQGDPLNDLAITGQAALALAAGRFAVGGDAERPRLGDGFDARRGIRAAAQQTLAGSGAQAGYAACVGSPVTVGGVQSTGAPFVCGQPRQVRLGVVLGL